MKRAFCCLAIAVATPSFAGVNSWTRTGPEGGPAYAVAFHPDTGVVFALSGPSIYRSEDGTASWVAAQNGISGGRGRILVHPANPSLVMASGINWMQRSDDGGKTFGAMTGPGAPPSYTFALAAPPDGSAVYAASASNDSKVFRTSNFGATWQEVSNGLPPGQFIWDLVADPQDVHTVYALLDGAGLYKTTDDGQNWTLVNALPGFNARKLAIDPGAPAEMLLATVSMSLQKSVDGGVNWAIDAGAVAVAIQFAWVGYTPSLPNARNGAAVAVPYHGRVIKRAARTQSWVTGADGKFLIVDDVAFDPHITDAVNSTLLVATREGPMLSQDGGTTFTSRSLGIRTATALGLATAHDVGGTLYAAFMDGPIGVHRRGANGWSTANNNNAQLRSLIPSAFQPTALAVNPSDATGLDVIVTSAGALLRSYDGGLSWSGPSPGVGLGILRSVQFAPSDSRNVYSGSDPDGVYLSLNSGVTWTKRANGLPLGNGGQSIGIGVVAVDPTAAGTAYAAVNTPGMDPSVYKTTDYGANWAPSSTGLGTVWIQSLVVDPSNAQTVYAGAGGVGEGVFKSTNGGASWARVGAPAGDDPGMSIAIDPAVPTTLIAAFNAIGTVSRSVDSGATWESLPALPAGASIVNNAVLDPLKPSNIVGAVSGFGLLEIEVAPDLAVTFATPPPTSIALGGSGAATMRVVNHGPFAASAVVLDIALPAGATAPVPTPTQGSCATSGGGFRCTLGAVHVSQQVQIPLTLNAASTTGQSALSASVAAHESDPVPSNDSVSASVVIKRIANLGVAIAASTATLDHHAALTLTATATNAGPNASTATQVAVDLGTAFGYQGATSSGGSCSHSGSVVSCSLGALDPAASATITVDVTAEGVGALTAGAAVSDVGLEDPSGANNSSTASVTSRPVADLAVQIADAADPVTSGQPLAYTATVTNNGPDDVVAATVTVNLVGATATSATSAAGTCVPSGSTVSCTLNALANGASATISIGTTAGSAGTATANASVAAGSTDKTSNNDAAAQSTTVSAAPSSGGGGGGGGGIFGELELLALLTLVLGRRRLRYA